MQLTPRALILLLVGAIPLAASTLWPAALLAAIAYFAVLLGLLFADAAAGPQKSSFQLSRACDSKLSLAADNAVRIHLYNAGGRPAQVTVRDEFPAVFQTDAWQISAEAPAHMETVFTYHVKPLRRGDYRFGDLNLRYKSRYGLLLRQESYPAAATVKVYPNLLEVRRYDLLARRGLLAEIGLRSARILGRGTEFERLRDYQPDDDYRRINWKATARRGRPMSTEYETERSQNIMLLLDAGRLMAAPIGPLAKLDHAVNAALMLAYVAARLGDNVGLLAFTDQPSVFLPPRRGRRQFLAMLEALYRLQAQQTEPDFNLAFRHFGAHSRKRSLVVLFTDLVDAQTSQLLLAHIGALSPHHMVLCVTLADPGIAALARMGPANTRGVYQRAVAEDVLATRRQAIERIRRTGARVLDLPADNLTAQVINQYLELKMRSRI